MRLNQITIPVLNIPKAIQFYKKLGLRLIVHTHDDYARFVCPDGGSTFSLHRVDQLPESTGTFIYFELDDLDEQVAILQSKGIVFEQLPKDQSWLWREARLKDIDQNQLILYKAGENRINPPWRIN